MKNGLFIKLKNNFLELSVSEVGATSFILLTVFSRDDLAEKLVDSWSENTPLQFDNPEDIRTIVVAYGILKNSMEVSK